MLPRPETNTLLLIALEAEAAGFVPAGARPYWSNPESPVDEMSGLPQQRAYRLHDTLTLALTGPMGFNMVAVATRIFIENQTLVAFERLVNFGAVGFYPWASGVELCQAYQVKATLRWDAVIPIRGYEFYLRELPLAADGTGKVCLTASRFSSNFEQSSHPSFIHGDVEDNELYDVAQWPNSIGLPLSSIKFVTNVATPEGTSQFEANLKEAQAEGAKSLRQWLTAP